ncbi:hypothetical protein ACK337_20310, partial [Aeromonas veronii]
ATGVSTGTVTITASGTANGTPFTASAQLTVYFRSSVPLGSFTAPDTKLRNWQAADAYCKGLTPAARLPTRAELVTLFLENTSATSVGVGANFEMCTVHGWPAGTMCGGSTGWYWTSEADWPGLHWAVTLLIGTDGSLQDTKEYHVTCVR